MRKNNNEISLKKIRALLDLLRDELIFLDTEPSQMWDMVKEGVSLAWDGTLRAEDVMTGVALWRPNF